MSTVRQRIVEQIVENLSNVVKESYVIPNTSNVNDPQPLVVSSGTYSGTTPLKYLITIYAVIVPLTPTITYEDVTNAGAAIPVVVTSGVPFSIGNGISITMTFTTLTVNDKWTVRMNKSASTIKKVLPWFSAGNNVELPHLLVYDSKEHKDLMAIERYDCTLNIHLILRYKEVNRSNNEINGMIGSIENEFNRDIHLTDASANKLSYNLYVVQSETFISEGSEEIVGAVIQCIVHYRHAISDTSTIKN